MLFGKKERFESKGSKYLERKVQEKEISDPLEIVLSILKQKRFLCDHTENDNNNKEWSLGEEGRVMRDHLIRHWVGCTAKTMSNIRHIENITLRSGTEYLIQIFAEDNLKAPFGFTRIIETASEEFCSDKFLFRKGKSRKMVLEYATVPSTSKDMLISWLEFVLDFIGSCGIDSGDIETEHQNLSDNPDPDHYFFERYVIKNIYHFGAESIATVSDKLDFEFENYDKKFPEDKKQRCFVHDDLRETDSFPHVIEVIIDVDRFILAVLLNNFTQERMRTSLISRLKLPAGLAPVKCAVFPLSIVDQRTKIATERVAAEFSKNFRTVTDEKGTLDMRKERYNEIGVPFFVEVDPEIVDNNLFRLHDNSFNTSSELDIHDIIIYIKSKTGC